jgi:hypothetical protein
MPQSSYVSDFGRMNSAQELPNDLVGSLGSLTQQAHLKSFRVARGIFLAVGILTIIVNLIGLGTAEAVVDQEINKQVETMQARGQRVNYRQMFESRLTLVRTAKVLSVALIAAGVLYLVFAATVHIYPVPITISGLVIYVGAAAVFALLDPTTIIRGIIFKIIITVALVKCVQSAIAYERERKEELAAIA